MAHADVSDGPAVSAAKPAATTDPLGFMDKLSDSIYVYRPEPVVNGDTGHRDGGASSPPRLVVVAAWMGARPVHVAKYLAPYRDGLVFGEGRASRRPTLLLIFAHNATIASRAKAAAAVLPAVAVVRAVLGDDALTTGPPRSSSSPPPSSDDVPLLIHTFSNGGCIMVNHLCRALAAVKTPGPLLLPPHVTLFDSCPARLRYTATVAAFSAGALAGRPPQWWRRLVVLPVVHVRVTALVLATLCAAAWGRVAAWWRRWASPGMPTPSTPAVDPWHPQNDPDGGNRREVRRAYLYSPGDALIPVADVEAHAAEARTHGFAVARMASFPNSSHVAHMRADGPRYWRTVREVWAGVDGATEGQ
ncbi:hypothetical protein SPI_06843 [Niveomyces insectorum RCEF 264]|uniref:Indole-diterpene biosynthesis protein n=1 Tax=Niveomyces insectorum RCEF 264 TaxID=1081102 RepID=A0A167QTV3_9HYPO|nr:hypothetical protein SPI_06843 [Niveomyces insectorum RCEF 264]